MNNTTNAEKIHNIGCNLEDPRLRKTLEKIIKTPSLAKPIVCLPDLNLKEKAESPSSFVAATRNTLVPEFSAPSLGCAMGLIATNLNKDNFNEEKFSKLFDTMQIELGPKYGFLKNLLLRLKLIKRPYKKYDFTDKDLENSIKYGAEFGIKRYNLPKEFLENVEYQGNIFTKEEAGSTDFKKVLPKEAFTHGKHDIGYGFKGNHFLEIQFVEEIFDFQTAQNWGLKQGQIVIMYHGGGGFIPYTVGRYFGKRKKNTLEQKIKLFIVKFIFHFLSFEGIKSFPKRWRYYFSPKPFQEIPANSDEGKRLFLAMKAALNYSYAFDMAIVRRIIDALEAVFSGENIKTRLLWNTIHNSIRKEKVENEELYVHRHTANKVFENRPVLISGFNNTTSYLGIGLKGATEHLFSTDHGAGKVIKHFEEKGISKTHSQNYITHIHLTKPPYKKVVHHITDEGVNYVMQSLENEGLIKPVARLRPLAVFKG